MADELPAEEEEGGGGGWLISYADLMTLLFAAFVVLYGITPQGKDDAQMGILAAVRESFVDVPDYLSERDENAYDLSRPGKFSFQATKGETRQAQVRRSKDTDDIRAVINQDRIRVDQLLDEFSTERKRINLQMRNAMTTTANESGFTIGLAGAYFFRPGSAKLTETGEARLIQLGQILQKIEGKLTIEGHTDDRGNNNDQLGALRAGYVASLLHDKNQISPWRMTTVSYGSDRPIADNKTEEGRRRNRRIEIKIEY